MFKGIYKEKKVLNMIKMYDFKKMPVVDVVNEILVDASNRRASDIHFDPWDDFLKVRIRIDGELIDYSTVPNDVKKNLITRIKIISGMNITETRLPQDGAIKAKLKDVDLDLRVSALPTSQGEKIVIRILDYSLSKSGIETLGFSDENYKKVLKIISVPNGIILVTGATGSGKSTTVYSILQRLNKEDTNIISVEDPIEMNIEGINQVQVNSEIGLTFASSLRSILRQDPNIIMIGEMRDTETAQIGIRASITGHLVLSTLHTNNSLNTIERLLDMEVERYLLSSALTGIVSQKLARELCPHCKKKRETTPYEKELSMSALGYEIKEAYDAVGCDKCGGGYIGRIAIHEVLIIDQDIRDAISKRIEKKQLRKLVYKTDVDTLLQDGLKKIEKGLTTFEEVLKLIEIEDDPSEEGHTSSQVINKVLSDSVVCGRDQQMKRIAEDKKNEVNSVPPKKKLEPDDRYKKTDDATEIKIIQPSNVQMISKSVTPNINNGFLKYQQDKTSNTVMIPLYHIVESILNKYSYNLPKPISNQKFNDALREIAKEAKFKDGITKHITIAGKKETIFLKKWQLVSTHTARRSFATNMFKDDIPTITIMAMTGHKTESSFMKYIKITREEQAQKLKDIWLKSGNHLKVAK
jgi:type IV pilus assembly protein PilB